jgi:hypothetical protein
MPFRVHEVVIALAMVLALVLCKHVPGLAHLPLSEAAAMVSLTFSIYLCLGIRRQVIEENSGA